MNNRLKGALLVGGTTALFSTFGLASRSVGLNGWQLAFLLNIGGLALGFLIAPGGTFTDDRTWPYALLAAILYLDNALILGAYAHTTFARAILLHYLGPVWVALYELLPFGRTPFNIIKPLWTILFAALSVVAIILMARPGTIAFQYGEVLALLSSLTLAGLIIGQNRLSRTAEPGDLMYTLVKWGFLFGAPAALYFSWPLSHLQFGLTSLGLGVFYGVIFRGVGTYAYNAGTRYLSGTAASFLGLLEIVGTSILGWLVYSEVPTSLTVVGGLLIVLINVAMIHPPAFMRTADPY